MNDIEMTTPASPEPDELKEQVAALRGQVTTLTLALFVLSGILSGFLYVQTRRARTDLNQFGPQANQIIELSIREEQAVRDFVAKLADFGRTHPDFLLILKKYGIPLTNAPATTAIPSIAPAPKSTAPAAPPKK